MKALIETLNNCKAILKDYYENDLAEAVNEYEVENQIDNIHRIMLMILPVENKFARKCSCCGKGMNTGYVINDGEAYYCEDACFKKEYKDYDIEDLELGDSENYWTEWEIDTDIEYIQVNKELIYVGDL